MPGAARTTGTVPAARAGRAGGDPAPRGAVSRVRGSWNRSSDLGPIPDGDRDPLRHTVRRMPTAILTGASRGLGFELTRALVADGWRAVVDARDAAHLERAAAL